MQKDELEKIIKTKLEEGLSLSKVQDFLAKEHSFNISFMDLRLLASDLEIIWKEDKRTPVANDNPIQEEEGEVSNDVIIELNSVKKPNEALSGSAKFPSGKFIQWAIDQLGQLSIADGGDKLEQEEIIAFQNALKEKLS